MKLLDRYLLRQLGFGFFAAALVLLPMFSALDLLAELDDVGAGRYGLWEAARNTLLLLPRRAVDLSPFIGLLGGIGALGQLAANQELAVLRAAGLSVSRIGQVAVLAGLLLALLVAGVDDWLAAPLQQQAQHLRDDALRDPATARGEADALWARHGNELARIGGLQDGRQPTRVEIFRFDGNTRLVSYLYAQRARIGAGGQWQLQDVQEKTWTEGRETSRQLDTRAWQSIFPDRHLNEMTLAPESLSLAQLRRYVAFLAATGQPTARYRVALWQNLGTPLLTLAMLVFSVPFAFTQPRAGGLGQRLALGAGAGLMVYVANQIAVNLGLLLHVEPLLVGTLPGAVLLLAGLLWMRRLDGRQRR